MKLLTISDVGYNHPSQANWNYNIFKIDFIDSEQTYCASYTVKENFGGDSRLKAKVKEQFGVNMIETKAIYTDTGSPKITGISKMWNAEGTEIIEAIAEFLK